MFRTADTNAPGSDELLLNRVGQRDPQAMTQIFDRYAGLVFSIALRVLKDPGQAEDVVQEIFTQIWQRPGAFVSSKGSLGAWLVVVARNRAIDLIRRRRPTDSLEDHVITSKVNIASEVERTTLMQKVRTALDTLPSEQRLSVELAYFDGLTQTEIAERTGDPLGTVKTRIRLALISLRRALQA